MPLAKRLKLVVCDTNGLPRPFALFSSISPPTSRTLKALPAERFQPFNNGGHVLLPIEFADNHVHLELDAILLTLFADLAKLPHVVSASASDLDVRPLI